MLIFFAARAVTIRTETSRDVVLPAVGGRSEAEVLRLYENAPDGARIVVESVPLRGTEIRLLLPEARPDGELPRPKEKS